MEWIEQAICRQVDPDLFVADGNSIEVAHKSSRAKAICKTCPVMLQCRAFAMGWARQSPIYGVWGGMTAAEINRQARHPARRQVA